MTNASFAHYMSRANAFNRWRSLLTPPLSSAGAEERETGTRYSMRDKYRTRFLLPLLHAYGGEGRGEEGQFRCVCPDHLSLFTCHFHRVRLKALHVIYWQNL